jgi:phosphopantetheinyl transferase
MLVFHHSTSEKLRLGPPYADSGVTFNLSHAGGVALLAFSRSRELGVDVEGVRRDLDVDSIARRYFSLHEQRDLATFNSEERYETFFRCWTRKEAYIKAKGEGLSLPLDQFDPLYRRPTLETMPVDAKAGCLYPNSARALFHAKERGFDNAIVCDVLGNVAELATSNVFMAKGGIVTLQFPRACAR